eukprot:5178680-Pyramimonas_sp.AAC.1
MELLPELPVPQGPLLSNRSVNNPTLCTQDPSRPGIGGLSAQRSLVTYLRDFHPGLDYTWRQFCLANHDNIVSEPRCDEASWPDERLSEFLRTVYGDYIPDDSLPPNQRWEGKRVAAAR